MNRPLDARSRPSYRQGMSDIHPSYADALNKPSAAPATTGPALHRCEYAGCQTTAVHGRHEVVNRERVSEHWWCGEHVPADAPRR